MSKRAEDLAKKLFPDPRMEDYDDVLVYRADRDNAIIGRVKAIKIYEQAEKDLALTWEDAVTMVTVAMDIIGEGKITGEQNIYTEVLRRFNSQREKK